MQIKKFGAVQTAKVMSILYLIITALIFFPLAIFVMSSGGKTKEGFPGWVFFFFPLIYGAVGFITISLICLLYNLLAKFIGGVEIDLE